MERKQILLFENVALWPTYDAYISRKFLHFKMKILLLFFELFYFSFVSIRYFSLSRSRSRSRPLSLALSPSLSMLVELFVYFLLGHLWCYVFWIGCMLQCIWSQDRFLLDDVLRLFKLCAVQRKTMQNHMIADLNSLHSLHATAISRSIITTLFVCRELTVDCIIIIFHFSALPAVKLHQANSIFLLFRFIECHVFSLSFACIAFFTHID